tara:strand:+ start:90 stop:461 length:372 start_codon:yes stop_codon:yes gene_type:complete
MKKYLFILIGILFPFFSPAQYISVVDDPEKADIKVFVSNVESRSDLLVYRTDLPKGYSWEHNEDQPILNNGNWIFINDEAIINEKIFKVFFVKYAAEADVMIYYVDESKKAEWMNKRNTHLFD